MSLIKGQLPHVRECSARDLSSSLWVALRDHWLELCAEKRHGSLDKFVGFLERQHVAAVEHSQASARDVLRVVLAVGQRDELVVPAPEDERGALDSPQVLRQPGIVQLRIPANAGGGFAGLEPLENARVIKAFGKGERNARVIRVFEQEAAEFREVIDE